MVVNGRSPNLRHVARTHRVDLDWLFERIKKDPGVFLKFVGTKEQLADRGREQQQIPSKGRKQGGSIDVHSARTWYEANLSLVAGPARHRYRHQSCCRDHQKKTYLHKPRWQRCCAHAHRKAAHGQSGGHSRQHWRKCALVPPQAQRGPNRGSCGNIKANAPWRTPTALRAHADSCV